MAMLTPAQKPRGLARMIFTGVLSNARRGAIRITVGRRAEQLLSSYLRGTETNNATPVAGVALARSRLASVVEFDAVLRGLDLAGLVAVRLLGDDTLDAAFLFAGADLAVVLRLLAAVVDDVGDRLVAFLDLDGVGADLAALELEDALAAAQRTLERHDL